MKFLIFVLFSVLCSIPWGAGAFANTSADAALEDASEVGGETVTRVPSSLPGARNGVSRKRYPGGADEDDLQVQATLPIPTRTFDGAATNAAVESGAADSAPSAATD